MSTLHSFARAAQPRSLAFASRAAAGALSVVLLAALGGCGAKSEPERVAVFPVQGSITFKGQPMPGAIVTLHPKAPIENVPSPRAQVDKDGKLKVTTFNGGDGAPAGEYTVTVQWYKLVKNGADLIAGPNVVPRKYGQPGSSDLVVKVAEAGPNSVDLKL